MGLETATWISELTTSNPPSSDNVSQGDDHIRLLKTVLQATFPNAGKAFYFQDAAAKTADYTVQSTDQHKWFTGSAASGTVDFTLPSLASGDAGWSIVVRCIDLTNAMRIVPASGTINGASSFSFSFSGQVAIVWWSGTTWYSFHHIPLDIHGTTEVTAPDVADEGIVYDSSATANRRITLANLLKVVNGLTEDSSPDLSSDFLLSYDTSTSAAKKVKPINVAPAATTSVAGKIEIADQSEVEAASATDKAMTPENTQWHPGVAKAWAHITGSNGNVNASHNITSVSRDTTGTYTITIATDFSSGNWAFAFAVRPSGNPVVPVVTAQSAGAITVEIRNLSNALTDPTSFTFIGFGDQ